MPTTKSIIQKILREHIDALIDEDYPLSWNLEEFKKMGSFKKRMTYCEMHLQKLAAGSGRIVYKIDEKMVLKLAKNAKGIAQNEVEIGLGSHYFSHIVAQTIDSDEDGLWVEMELATKVTPTLFKQYAGVDIDNFYRYIQHTINTRDPRKGHKLNIPDEVSDILNDNELAYDTVDFLMSSDAASGDLGRLSSWGLVKRSHGPQLVIVDYGINDDVIKQHYTYKSNQNQYR